jgi:hypothetical protein
MLQHVPAEGLGADRRKGRQERQREEQPAQRERSCIPWQRPLMARCRTPQIHRAADVEQ